jgi:hypothetical protein
VELFAANHVVVIPAGIGVAPPLARDGVYVRGGRCEYAVRTLEPTGVTLLGPGGIHTLGELFDLWGQHLDRHQVAGFRARAGEAVSVYFDGGLCRGDPATVPLTNEAQITIEVGPYVPPHARYLFPPLAALDQMGSGRRAATSGTGARTRDPGPSRGPASCRAPR